MKGIKSSIRARQAGRLGKGEPWLLLATDLVTLLLFIVISLINKNDLLFKKNQNLHSHELLDLEQWVIPAYSCEHGVLKLVPLNH